MAYYEASGTPPGRWLGTGLADLGAIPPIGIEPPHRADERPGDDGSAAHDDGRRGRDDGRLARGDGRPTGGDGSARVGDGRGRRGRVRPGDVVSEAGMVALFRDGCDPLTGAPLGRGYAGRRVRPVVGFDLTFTIPKSASVLWALGDARTRSAVIDAHHAAVSQALRFVEHSVVRTRVGAGGRRQVRTRGMIAAGFDHWDSRAGDPNLHTHVVLANKVQGADKQWRALDGKTVLAATVMVSELYDGLLADELHRRLPVTWSLRPRGDGRNPAWEIDGLDDRLLAAFSSRSERIHEAELDWTHEFRASHGRGPSRVETIKARGHLTRTTRPAKVIRPLADLFSEWANRARALTGIEPVDLAARALARLCPRSARPRHRPPGPRRRHRPGPRRRLGEAVGLVDVEPGRRRRPGDQAPADGLGP